MRWRKSYGCSNWRPSLQPNNAWSEWSSLSKKCQDVREAFIGNAWKFVIVLLLQSPFSCKSFVSYTPFVREKTFASERSPGVKHWLPFRPFSPSVDHHTRQGWQPDHRQHLINAQQLVGQWFDSDDGELAFQVSRVKSQPPPSKRQSLRSFVWMESTPKLLWEVEAPWMWKGTIFRPWFQKCLANQHNGVATPARAPVLIVEQYQGGFLYLSGNRLWYLTPSNPPFRKPTQHDNGLRRNGVFCQVWDWSEGHGFWWKVFK